MSSDAPRPLARALRAAMRRGAPKHCALAAFRSAEEVEIHVRVLVVLLLDNLLLLLLRRRARTGVAAAGRSSGHRAASASAAELQHPLEVLPLAHLGEQRWEEWLDRASSGLDQSVDAVLRDVQLSVLQDHGRIATEQLVLLRLGDIGSARAGRRW